MTIVDSAGPAAAGTAPATVRDLVEPALRAAVATLPESMALIAGYHLGWHDPGGRDRAPGAVLGTWGARHDPDDRDRAPGAELGTRGARHDPDGRGRRRSAVGGGKALRPAFAIAAARAVGGDAASAVPAAVAVELVHNFSLLHDDVMDGDTTRRHRPAAWTVFGTSAALLAGSALLTLAFDVLAGDAGAARLLGDAVQELLDGQHADLGFERRAHVAVAECRKMALAKTGALLGCACALGGLAGGATAAQATHLTEFGRRVGLAFQYVDDLLGIWGDPAVTGKPVHSDLASRKKSLPVVAALNSGTAAGDELAVLYHREAVLSAAELRAAAGMVEEAGGRAYAREQAGIVFADALAELSYATSDGGAELAALARAAVRRDR